MTLTVACRFLGVLLLEIKEQTKFKHRGCFNPSFLLLPLDLPLILLWSLKCFLLDFLKKNQMLLQGKGAS